MKKVLLLLAEGFEEIEALTVVDVLRRANVQCDTCSIKEREVSGSHDIVVVADITLDDENLNSYDAIVLPGGMPGAANLKENIRVVDLVKDYYASGRIVAAICAAPIVLAKAGIIDGKLVTSYPSFDKQLEHCIYKDELVVVDGNIITSRGPATALPFSYKLLEKLGCDTEAYDLREGMMYNFLMDSRL
jgi:4-methyl-5(b-hydroxyethyl)-thiazole monophosphate biosynthesis